MLVRNLRKRHFNFFFVVILALIAAFVSSFSILSAQIAINCADYAAAAPAASPGATLATSSPEAAADLVAFPKAGGEVTVFAAASLTDAFEQIGADITTANPEVSFVFNFAGTQALVTQLTEGAEADVFVSANPNQMNAASEAGVIMGEPAIFAQNELVIIVPADNPAGISTSADLDNDGVTFVTAQAEVPVGQYTRQSVCLMGADTATYGDEFVDGFAANIVSEEESVRAIATKISLGEADAGIVYATDVTPDIAETVLIIEIPDAVNVIADYPIAAVTDGDPALADAFISYLLGTEGQATLASFGFLAAP